MESYTPGITTTLTSGSILTVVDMLSGTPSTSGFVGRLLVTAGAHRIAATANARVRGIAGVMTDPFGRALVGEQQWPSAGQSILNFVTAPAIVMHGVAATAIHGPGVTGADYAGKAMLGGTADPLHQMGERLKARLRMTELTRKRWC